MNTKNIYINNIQNYQDKLYPFYSSTSMVKSKYSILYHMALSHALGRSEDLEKNLLLLSSDLDKHGLLREVETSILGNHSKEYVDAHMSSIFYQYQDKPSQNFFDYIEKTYANNLDTFFAKLDFDNAWSVSNEIMARSTFFGRYHQDSKSNLIFKLSEMLLKHNTFKNGLWESNNSSYKGLINSIAATFHYLPLFIFNDIKIPGSEDYIEYLKKLYLKNGFFSSPDGYACIDYDAVYMIFYYLIYHRNKLSTDDENFIRNAVNKLSKRILDIQNDDGGFPEYGYGTKPISAITQSTINFLNNKCINSYTWNLKKVVRQNIFRSRITYSNSSKYCGAFMNESSVFATWFRVLTLEVNDQIINILDNNRPLDCKQSYNGVPGLGYMPFKINKK